MEPQDHTRSSTDEKPKISLDKLKLDVSEFSNDHRSLSPVLSPSLAGQAPSSREIDAQKSSKNLFNLNSDELVHEVLNMLNGEDTSVSKKKVDGWMEDFEPFNTEKDVDFPSKFNLLTRERRSLKVLTEILVNKSYSSRFTSCQRLSFYLTPRHSSDSRRFDRPLILVPNKCES